MSSADIVTNAHILRLPIELWSLTDTVINIIIMEEPANAQARAFNQRSLSPTSIVTMRTLHAQPYQSVPGCRRQGNGQKRECIHLAAFA